MGHAFQSPLRRWDVLSELCHSIDARTFVEVGCKEGRTTGRLLAQHPALHVLAVDPWVHVEGDEETYAEWDFRKIQADFWANVGEHKDRCEQLCMTSEEAAGSIHAMPNIENRSGLFDVIFIDAQHDYEHCLQDIRLWWPKVRPGGYLCGHDYQHTFPGVMRAVASAFPLLRVAVCPDSVWIVNKDPTLQIREAA